MEENSDWVEVGVTANVSEDRDNLNTTSVWRKKKISKKWNNIQLVKSANFFLAITKKHLMKGKKWQ